MEGERAFGGLLSSGGIDILLLVLVGRCWVWTKRFKGISSFVDNDIRTSMFWEAFAALPSRVEWFTSCGRSMKPAVIQGCEH